MIALGGLIESQPPDGWFCRDLLWYDTSLTAATILSRGARVELPDLKSADSGTCESYYEALGTMLCQLDADEAVQFQWRVDADYHAELEAYRAQTGPNMTPWCRAVREERYRRYATRQAQGALRRERLDIFVGKRCSTVPKRGFRSPDQMDRYVDQSAKNLAERLMSLEGRMPGASVTVHDDREHYAVVRSFLQPSARGVGEARYEGFHPGRTILENCWPGGGITTRDPEGNVYFRMDGQYHAILVMRQWPMQTHFGIIWRLTTALAGNYVYTLTCLPRDAQREVAKEELELRRVKGSRRHEDKDSLDDVIARKRVKISAMQNGFTRPYSVLPVLRVWAPTLEALGGKVQALKEAVSSMGGAKLHQVDHEVQAKRLFFETLPGWTGGRYREWDLFALAGTDPTLCFLQDMVPLSSSYTGHLDVGEAIYDGDAGNLVGVRTFAADVPQHAVMTGTTRVGKSSQVIDYLSQTDYLFAFRGIVEEGLSYGTFVQLVGGETIVLHPDAELTINYLDTHGLPLTRIQLAAAAGLLQVMVGKATDPEINQMRKALYVDYIDQLYSDCWRDYSSRNPEAERRASRWALLLAKSQRDVQGTAYHTLSPLEMFADLREMEQRNPGQLAEYLEQFEESEVVAYARRPETAKTVRDYGLAFIGSDAFPTHTALVEAMRFARFKHHDREMVDRLATRLAAWQRTGPNGKLFDGVNNVALQKRLVHFELGLLPDSNREMKEAAMYLVANRLRQRVITMPRAQRKQFIFEEPSRYLQVGGVEELFAEFYAQMGKFSCHIMPVTQQYGQLAKSALRSVIFGNSKQFFLFKQNDRHDLDDQGDAIGLPAAARAMIRRFSAPEYQTGDAKYSQMAVFSQEGERAQCGEVRNYSTPEMLYVSDSSGATHDRRAKALAEYVDPLDGVLSETERERAEKKKRRKPEIYTNA